jgi:hypothetical protein
MQNELDFNVRLLSYRRQLVASQFHLKIADNDNEVCVFCSTDWLWLDSFIIVVSSETFFRSYQLITNVCMMMKCKYWIDLWEFFFIAPVTSYYWELMISNW